LDTSYGTANDGIFEVFFSTESRTDILTQNMGGFPITTNYRINKIEVKVNSVLVHQYDLAYIAGHNTQKSLLETITEGLQVFADGNMPIGEIGKVYENSSLVMLYSNPGQVTEAMLEGSNTTVELIGRGGGNFEMTIPLDLPSENGKLVVLPSTQSGVIAVIDALLSVPTDPVKKVLLRSPVNIQSLKWVQIKRN
jgi:hypothetical protein